MVMLQRWPVSQVREWSCYRGGQFNGGRMVVTKDICLMEGEWSC